MTNTIKIPAGYRMDAQGRLVPIDTIKAIDLLRDELVCRVADSALHQSRLLKEFRGTIMDDINAFVASSAERFKVRMGGTKGNLSLFSFDGRFKVVVANQDNITFDERLQVAKALVDKCIKKWSQGSTPEIIALVNDAFQVDRSGNVSIRRVLGLRQLDIEDRDWKKAMDAISESVQVVGSKSYVRVYERDDKGEYLPINLDLARV